MNRILALGLSCMLMLTGCAAKEEEPVSGPLAGRPMLRIGEAAYIALYMPVNELPAG